jgi:protein TonB
MFFAVSLLLLSAGSRQDSDKVVITGARIVPGEKIERVEGLPPSLEPALPKGWQPPVPAGNPGTWVTTDDYPADALRNDLQGTVRFRLAVNPQGRVADCTITQSSGSDLLDTKACSLISERAVFSPGRDKRGRAVAGTYSNAVRWVIPNHHARPEATHMEFVVTVEADGSISRCELVRADGMPSGFREQFEKNCASTNAFEQPYLDESGQPVRRKVRQIMKTTIEPAS